MKPSFITEQNVCGICIFLQHAFYEGTISQNCLVSWSVKCVCVCVCVSERDTQLSYTGANAAVALHVMPMLKTNPFAVSHASDICGVVSILASIFFFSFSSVYVIFYFATM